MNDRGDRSATKRAATASRDPVRVVCWEQRPPIILGLQRIEISGHRPQRPTRRDGATTQRIQSLDMLLPDANACAPAAEDVTLNQYGRTVHENVSGFFMKWLQLRFDFDSTIVRRRTSQSNRSVAAVLAVQARTATAASLRIHDAWIHSINGRRMQITVPAA